MLHKYISDNTKIKIIKFMNNSFENEINTIVNNKSFYKKLGQLFENISKIMVALGSLLSFSSAFYNVQLSFIAGIITTISLVFHQFSNFCYKENKKNEKELNTLLDKINLDIINENIRNMDEIKLEIKNEENVKINTDEINSNIT